MEGPPATISRRTVLRGAALLGAAGMMTALPGCSTPFAGTRLTVATGLTQGVYYTLGMALAEAWRDGLGLSELPAVRSTAGSVANLELLASGGADVVFSQVDTAADQLAVTTPDDPRAPRALARIYDDVVHIVVRRSSPYTRLADLRGARVSVGPPESGVFVIATRLLRVAGLAPETDLRAVPLGINDSVAAMVVGEIDAFFWSGGVPTSGVTELATTVPIRLLDLDDLLVAVRTAHPVYASGTVPAATYGIPSAITTVLVRNVLLVGARMPDDLAGALVDAMFAAQNRLTQASAVALTIDPRSAIGTQPVPLHPGAAQFYRTGKNG